MEHHYGIDQKPDSKPELVAFISQAGLNTVIILRNNSSGTFAHCDQINKRLSEPNTRMNNEDDIHDDPINNEKLDPSNSDRSDIHDMPELLVTKEEHIQNRRTTRSTRGRKPIRFRDVKP